MMRATDIDLCFGAALLAVVAACLAACSGEAEGGPSLPDRPERGEAETRRVDTIGAEAVEHRTTWEVRGVLEPHRIARASFIVGGRLSKVLVERGEVVREGQPLARLDTAEVGAGVAQTKAALAAAEAQVSLADDALGRLEKLSSQNAIAEADVVKVRLQREAAVALREQARAAVQMAGVKSGQHVLVAPMAGTVLDVPDRIGEIVGPGIPQFEIADLTKLRFRGSLPGEAAGRIEIGQAVAVARRTGTPLIGRISYVSPALTADTHRLPFEAEVEPPEDQSQGIANSYVAVSIESSTAVTVARVPASCIVRREDTAVFVVSAGGTAERRVVTVVRNTGDQVLVEGLDPGAEVISLPPVDLEDGASVQRTLRSPAKRD